MLGNNEAIQRTNNTFLVIKVDRYYLQNTSQFFEYSKSKLPTIVLSILNFNT